ncbi:ABC transporter ATP-binding protein [Segetibacter sp. 3557_3]|uniref:ABC transporter ATP-binding protein n=1 Tax=Segetibacter sp. 3557_3 TaxID=2547429 RepID=UPI0014055D0E|nr:ABC transporter ATP-binding protein [Segetibacter sp. 3557_3]
MVSIKAENLSKAYQLGEFGTGTISRDLERWFSRVRGKEDPFLKIGETNDRTIKGKSNIVWSLKDIDFEISQGDAVGIIGRNGAGKSTLLKVLSRVTSPTTGFIKVKGRIASLLEVGTGFHPELTGRENIFLNGAILGMRKREIASKFDEIVDFAGVERYIDTPVKRYSSGMYVRLAFAVAAHLDSEILVVDEVLAVGDADFQQKCLGKMGEVSKGEGRTILFVSHNMNSISTLCRTAILLSNGKVQGMGTSDAIISQYLSSELAINFLWQGNIRNSFFTLTQMALVNGSLKPIETGTVKNNDRAGIMLDFELTELNKSLCVGIAVFSSSEDLLFWSYQTDMPQENWVEFETGKNKLVIWLPERVLNEGEYTVKAMVSLHFISWLIDPVPTAAAIRFSIRGGLSDSIIWNDKRPGILAPVLNYQKING